MGLLYDRGPGLPFNLALLILQDKIQLTRTKTKQNKTKQNIRTQVSHNSISTIII